MHHHHGDNPRCNAAVFNDGGFDLNKWLDENGKEITRLVIVLRRKTSAGMIRLYGHTDTCQLFNNGGELDTGTIGCVTGLPLPRARCRHGGSYGQPIPVTMIVKSCNQLPGENWCRQRPRHTGYFR